LDPQVDADAVDAILDRAFPDPEGERVGLNLATVVVHRGQLVAEHYGPTASWEEPLISWSMGKSFTHALVGVLVAQGRLSLEDRVVPEWFDVADSRVEVTLERAQ